MQYIVHHRAPCLMLTILLPVCLSLDMKTQPVDCENVVVLVSPHLVFQVTVVMLFPAVRVVFFVEVVCDICDHDDADN